MSDLVSARQKVRKTQRKQPPRAWDQLYGALVEFFEEHGHTNPPRSFKDSGLLWWIAKQRRNRDKLTDDQRKKLEVIGFDLSTQAERKEKQWNEKFERLKEFRIIYGHSNCPQTALFDEDLREWADELGAWVQDQRQNYKQGKLRDYRQQKLESIAFEFSIKPHKKKKDTTKEDERWQDMYLRLMEFHEKYGHCVVSRSYQASDKEQDRLANWVTFQRQAQKDKLLRADRRQLLEEINFAWKFDVTDPNASIHQQEWNRSFQQLLEYKKTHGHANPPRTIEIGQWLGRQKQFQSQGALDDTRELRLAEAGVAWAVDYEERWDDNFSKLKQYHTEHGDCLVPKGHDIWKWATHQRTRFKQGKLSRERREALDSLQFSWNVLDDRWDDFYRDLESFQRRSGHCFVPLSESKELAHWVQSQRTRQRNGKMPAERKQKLENIGFSWASSLDKCWESNLAQLSDFITENGHNIVPMEHPIYRWLSKLQTKYHQGKIDPEAQTRLESIEGFEWPPSLEDRWDENWEKLKRYKERHGHCSPPYVRNNAKRWALNLWANSQRNFRRNNALSTERIKKLDDIGFDWDGPGEKRKRDKADPIPAVRSTKKQKKGCNLVGERVAVYWSDDEEFYKGTVKDQRPNGEVYVEYDDGDKEWVQSNKSSFNVLDKSESSECLQKQSDLLTRVTRGSRVKVWWPAEKQYYKATVAKICNANKNPHYLVYDDGDEQRTNLQRLKFKLLKPCVTK